MLRVSLTNIKIPHMHVGAKLFAHLAFFVSSACGAFSAIFPLILEKKLGGATFVGMYYAAISLICIVCSILSTHLFTRFSKIFIARLVLVLLTLLIFGMNFAVSVWHLAFLDIPRAICIMFTYIVLALFIRDFSTRNEVAESQGHYYFYSNLGWMVGPLLAGLISSRFGIDSIFNLVSSLLFVCWIYFELHGIRDRHQDIHAKPHNESLMTLAKNISSYFKVPALRKVFWVSFGINFWWAVRTVYVPLAIIQMGFGEKIVGFLMALGVVPCVLLERYVVKLSQRDGVRTYISIGFWYLACFVSLFFFLSDYYHWVLLFFILSNIGAALVEPLKSVYFFEVVKKQDSERFWGIYNVAEYAAFMIGPFLASCILSLTGSLPKMWAGIAVMMVIFSLFSLTIEKKAKK